MLCITLNDICKLKGFYVQCMCVWPSSVIPFVDHLEPELQDYHIITRFYLQLSFTRYQNSEDVCFIYLNTVFIPVSMICLISYPFFIVLVINF
jgi:hypothetical protein